MMDDSAILDTFLDQRVRETHETHMIKRRGPRCVSVGSETISEKGERYLDRDEGCG